MAPGNLDILVKKVKAIARGPHADLLEKLTDLLYEREMEEEYFSPEDEAAIAKDKAQIARREYVTLEEWEIMEEDPVDEKTCIHGVADEMECVHCLLSYADYEFQRAMEYARFLEQYLQVLLGDDWNRLTLEEVQQLPNIRPRSSAYA